MEIITKSQGVGARVCFAWENYEEKPFWYSTDLSIIHKLGISPEHNKLFIQKGLVIDFGNEGKGKIIEVQVEVGDEYLVEGPTVRGHGKNFPFTLDVVIIVERV